MDLIDDATADSVSTKDTFISVSVKSFVKHDTSSDFVNSYDDVAMKKLDKYGSILNSNKRDGRPKKITRKNSPAVVSMTSMKYTGDFVDDEVCYGDGNPVNCCDGNVECCGDGNVEYCGDENAVNCVSGNVASVMYSFWKVVKYAFYCSILFTILFTIVFTIFDQSKIASFFPKYLFVKLLSKYIIPLM